VSDPGKPLKYRMLHTIRAYAHARLAEAGELGRARQRAIDRLVHVTEPILDHQIISPEDARQLAAEGENLTEAVRSLAGGTSDERVRLTIALAQFWQTRDHTTPGRELLSQLLDEVTESPYLGRALSQAAIMAWAQADQDEALRLAVAAVSCERASGVPARLAIALDQLSRARTLRGEFEAALAARREILAHVPAEQRLTVADYQQSLAWLLLHTGQVDEAGDLVSSFLPVIRAEGTVRSRAAALHTVGTISLARGELDQARAFFVEGLSSLPPDSYGGGHLLGGLAMVAAGCGEYERALCLSAASDAVWHRIGCRPEPDWQRQVDVATTKAQSRLSTAKAAAARGVGGRLRGKQLLAYAVSGSDVVLAADSGSPLTDREKRIACLVAEGLTNSEIAVRLRLPVRTVAAHLDSIRDKLDMRSRTQIAVWAAERLRGARS
jgi:DNA-binding CsgD family transcriptional regulator